MTIKLFNDEEKIEFRKWFNFFTKGVPEIFSSNFIVGIEKDGTLGCGIMVQPILHTEVCMFNFLTRNPYCDKTISSESVDFLIEKLPIIAKDLGYKRFVSLVGEEPAKLRYRKKGVKESKKALTLFWGESDV